jgi:hypothetical protein
MAVSITIKIDGASLRDKPRRRVVLGLILGAALALPVGALAGHRFTDVPTTHTFHGNIDNLADAGITAGCGPTSFCPEAPVSRGQMAAFLNRGLGRVASKVVSAQPSSGGEITVGTISITPGTAPGAGTTGKQFVAVRFDGFAAATSTVGCPCTMTLQLANGQVVYQTFTSSLQYEAVSIAVVIGVEGAAEVDIALKATLPGNGFQIGGTLTATTVPYGPDGTSSTGTGS